MQDKGGSGSVILLVNKTEGKGTSDSNVHKLNKGLIKAKPND